MTSSRNKTKHIAILVVTALAITVLASCDSFLTRTPENAIASTEFFKNAEQAEQGVLGIYAKLQDMYGNQWRLTEQRSDNTTVQFNDANRGPHPTWFIEEFVVGPSNVVIESYWQDVYQGIQRSNAVLDHIENVEFSDKNLQDQLMGEAKFLRAFFYFNLVRLFGDVPLVLDRVQNPSEAFSTIGERTAAEKVYEQIIKDASDAAGLLPTDNPGRATEGAARTLLADIHLTRQNYSDAVTELKKVMEMGYSLLPDYRSVFDPANKGNRESIFAVQYAELESNRSLGSTFIYTFAPHNSGTEITGDNAANPTGLNIPTRDIISAYEPGDPRKDLSIGFFVDSENRQHGIAIGDTIPYIEKFASSHSVRGVTNDNWPVYRYAEVLLMMAEALNELGNTSEAYSYINQVRQRAGLDNLTAGLPQMEFREAVYHEERVELAFENDRWFNLLRTGRALEEMRIHGEVHRGIQPHLTQPVYNIAEYKLKYPIPQRELTLNPGLNQNSGW